MMRKLAMLATLISCLSMSAAYSRSPCDKCSHPGGYHDNNFRPPCHQIAPSKHGPLELVIDCSDRFGWFIDPKYTNNLGAYNALYLEFGFGSGEFRAVGTWGTIIRDYDFLKVTAEYFAQEPDFDFTAGRDSAWVGQYGLGAEYVMNYSPDGTFTNVHCRVLYTCGRNESLSDATMGGTTYSRRATGARNYGGTVGIRLRPWFTAFWDLEIHYDAIEFDDKFSPTKTRVSGFGASAIYTQRFGKKVLLILRGTDRQPYYIYSVDARYVFDTPPGVEFTFGCHAEYIAGASVPEPKESRYGIGIYYSWGGDPYYHDDWGYASPLSGGVNQELVEFTSKPAIRTPQVLAKMEEMAQ